MNWRDYGKILIIGNGGSYANAIHVNNDFLMVGLPAFTLDPATLTAFANDHGYENVYSMWVEKVGKKGDLLIALSGSGKSPNIINALWAAKAKQMTTLGIFGAYNEHEPICDILSLGGDTMQEAEQYQLVWAHEVMLRLRK